jgi:glycosyltransferase involved in cell wall biosynthesis
MSQLERLLFLGFLVRDEDASSIFQGEAHPQYSALRFQRNVLRALEAAGLSIDAITTPPIAAFPRNHHWWVRGVQYQLDGVRVQGRQMSCPNLPGVRLFGRLAQAVRLGLLKQAGSFDGILVYSVHTPLVAAALVLKWLRRTPVFVFIPDLPTFMGGPSNILKHWLKRLDAAVVRRLLVYTDGAFPITDGIGRDWLVDGPKHWTMEGISDPAAAALAAARTNRSYVFRGGGRPILLYTGALEYVLPFASAFHRSSIDALLLFVGGGVDAVDLQALAARDARIKVKPFMTGDALAREVERADFMLNPRDPAWPGAAYSFPSKLVEYLITGKPIVSTRLPGIPDEYFGVFRPVDLADQAAFESSLVRAIAIDLDPAAIWGAAERLARRLASASVGNGLVQQMRQWAIVEPGRAR